VANNPSAEKANRQSIKRRTRNRAAMSALRTAVKKARTAIDGEAADADSLRKSAISIIDKAVSRARAQAQHGVSLRVAARGALERVFLGRFVTKPLSFLGGLSPNLPRRGQALDEPPSETRPSGALCRGRGVCVTSSVFWEVCHQTSLVEGKPSTSLACVFWEVCHQTSLVEGKPSTSLACVFWEVCHQTSLVEGKPSTSLPPRRAPPGRCAGGVAYQ
jgi:small subunit ribosomal protein S20